MRRIRIANQRLSNNEKSFLNEDYTPSGSTTSVTVVSNLTFADNDILVVGEVGDEKTEAKDVTGTSGDTIITISAALKFSHNKTTTVYKSRYNQVSIERAVTSVGSFSEIVLTDIQWDKLETLYEDVNGTDSHSYRFRLYNSLSAEYSEYSPTITGSGFARGQVGKMIQNVRRKIKDPNKQRFADAEIIEKLQDGQVDIQSNIPNLWFLRVDTYKGSNGIATVASSDTYDLDVYTDLNYVDKIRYSFVLGSVNKLYDLEKKSEIEFDQYIFDANSRTETDRVLRYKFLPPDASSDKGYIVVDPVPTTTDCTFYPIYYKKFTELADVSDTTELPFPEMLEDYAAWKLSELLGNFEKAKQYKALYTGPDDESKADGLTGLAKLRKHNDRLKREQGYGRSLFRFRGRRPNNYYTRYGDSSTADYYRENFSDPD